MSGKQPTQSSNRGGNGPVVRFVLTFLVGMALFQLAFFQVTDDTAWFESYMAWNTSLSGGLLRLFGVEATNKGTILQAGPAAVRVLRGCDGLQPMAYYALAVLSFPAPWKHRLWGALAGLSFFPLLNVARIATLVLLRRDHPGVFEVAHVTVWPTVFIFVALLLWLGWARWTLGRTAPSQAPPAA